MASFEEVLALANRLPAEERERLARQLSSSVPVPLTQLGAAPPPGLPRPHSVAWIKAERGHAVLATDTGPADEEIPAGAEAVTGMWADLRGVQP